MKTLLFTIAIILTIAQTMATVFEGQATKKTSPLSSHSKLVVENIWFDITGDTYPFDDQLEKPEKVIPKKVQKQPKAKPGKTLSRGEKRVQEMLERNRQKLKNLQQAKKAKSKKESTKNKITDFKDLKSKNDAFLRDHKKINEQTLRSWEEESKKTLSRWKNSRNSFLNNLSDYEQTTFDLESALPQGNFSKKAKWNKNLPYSPKYKISLIKNSLELKTKDQKKRPTCSSFAGVRSMEILAASNNELWDLSEQYFYWLSKPTCHTRPCSNKGAWVEQAFLNSKKANSPNIPSEQNCPYSKKNISSNQTQTPLQSKCSRGFAKVVDYKRLNGMNDILKEVDRGHPVVIGLKLTPNFYTNTGFVGVSHKAKSNFLMNSHAKGHAMVISGYMNLPQNLWGKEGRICFIAANSWGEGWGRGGFTCLSESWIKKNQINKAMVSLEKIRI